jgi:hypothetical protein
MKLAFILALAAAAWPANGRAEDVTVTARAGVEQAFDAARTWSQDAFLIYVENDQPLGPQADATRWGYLFHSPSRGTSRGYSIMNGEIEVAEDLDFTFDCPPLPGTWVDSADALAAAEKDAGQEYREKTGGEVASMFLVSGILHPKNPEAATWAVFYTSPSEPSLWIVVDAETGGVVRTWRG